MKAIAIGLFLLAAMRPVGADGITHTEPGVTGRAIVMGGNIPDPRVYAIDPGKNRITLYGAGELRHAAVGPIPSFIVRDQGSSTVYVSNAGDGSFSMVQEETLAVTTLPLGVSGPLAVGDRGEVYVLDRNPDGGVVVVDPRTRSWFRLATGPGLATGLALGGGRLYVAVTRAGGKGEVQVFAQASASAPLARIALDGYPGPIVFNTGNNKLYVAMQVTDRNGRALAAIDAATHATELIMLPGEAPNGSPARAIAASSNTNQVFAGYSDQLVLVDGRTHLVTRIPTGDVVAIHPGAVNRRTFALDRNGVLTIVENESKRVESVSIPGDSFDVTYAYKTGAAFVIGSALTVVRAPGSEYPPMGINAQNLWWALNGKESGWGINVAHQGDTVFATWFTYDAAGRATWYVMSDAKGNSRNSYFGTVYRTTGPPFGAAFDAARVTRTPVGEADLVIINGDNATINATIDGVRVRKDLSRQVFAWPSPTCSQAGGVGVVPNYQDLWWNSSESGWGLNIAHQGDVLFVTWFTYDGDGQPLWLVGSSIAKAGNATYAGTLYRTSGPPLAASPWDPARVSRMPAGTITLTFADNDEGTFAYSVDGVSRTKAITRQRFASPATHCR